MTVCVMCPAMSLWATVIFQQPGIELVPSWLQTVVCNFPMAFFWQIFFCGPLVRRLFRLRINRTSLVRGALLHDFFLYDWHEKNAGHPFHGWTHPATALYNARRRFPLNYREQNIIRSHMWPFTLRKLPRCREAVLVNLADKICSSWEILRPQPYRSLFHQLQEQRLIWMAEEKR